MRRAMANIGMCVMAKRKKGKKNGVAPGYDEMCGA
jgi:hypothetical protein